VHFDHPQHDALALTFPLASDDFAARDELFEHLGYQPGSYLARLLNRKQIGAQRARTT
jgi:hypothetical protein